ncbi:MAG: tetratricopeptide repeat protein [Muribaculaceae bacterium]|nr:tetratricopeptide repeat protein [Muribaculaceae bacterium]
MIQLKRIAGFLMMCLLLIMAQRVSGSDREVERQRAKSRHYFLSGAQSYASTDFAEAYELFRKAYESDTTNGAAALEYAIQYTPIESMLGVDTVLRERLLRSGRKLVDDSPGDFYTVYNYAMLNAHIDNLPEAIRVMERFKDINPGHTIGLEVLNDLYLDNRQFDESLDILNKYERIKGMDIKLLLRKSAVYIAKGDTAGAVEVARAYVRDNPSNPQSWLLKGQIENYVQHKDSAMASYERAEELSGEGNGGPAKIQIAQMYREAGDSVRYNRKVYEALLADDLSMEVKKDFLQYYITTQLMDSVDDGNSDRLLDVIVTQYPHEPEILSLASDYHAYRKNYEKALDEMRYCIDLSPTSMEYRERGMLLAYFADNLEAMDSIYHQAERFFTPLEAKFITDYSRMLSAKDEQQKALNVLRGLLKRDYPGVELTEPLDMASLDKKMSVSQLETLIDIYGIAGDSYSQLKEYPEETRVCYENVLPLNPDDQLMLNNYAYYLVRDSGDIPADELARAKEMSSRAVANDPDNPTYIDTQAWVLYRAGDYEAALELQMAAVSAELAASPDDESGMTELYDHLGDILYALDRKDEARQYWEKALSTDPDNIEISSKLKSR